MSFLRSTISRSLVQPLFAQRALSTLAELKLIGRISQEPLLLKDKHDKPYVSYTIAVANPSSFGNDVNGVPKEPTTSYYRVAAFQETQVQKLIGSIDNNQLGKGSLVHALAAVEQAAREGLTETGKDGKDYPVMQFNLQHRTLDILVPSTARRDELAAAKAAAEGN